MLSVVDSLESAVNSSPQNKDELTDETKDIEKKLLPRNVEENKKNIVLNK